MTQLEKKFSDYQKSECETQEINQPVDERLCPDCIPNPSFKLEDRWYKIKHAYLDESVCEYRVRIYELRNEENDPIRDEGKIIDLGIDKILISQKKILNNEIRESLKRFAYISKSFIEQKPEASINKLGKAFLVSIPSIALDKIPNLDESEDQDGTTSEQTPEEIIIDFKDLNTKLVQISGALYVYEVFYANANFIKEQNIIIVEKENPLKRFSYKNLRDLVKKFRQDFSEVLDNNGFVELFELSSFFKSKRRPKKIKLVFENSEDTRKKYSLLRMYAYVAGCEEYEELDFNEFPDFKGSSFAPLYHLLANLDSVINDITAEETKPWLEFTIDNVYPEVVVDYGDAGKLTDEDYAKFGCLLENSFGVGRGQLANTVYTNAISYFKTLENDLYKEACRSINETSTRSTRTKENESSQNNDQDLAAEYWNNERKQIIDLFLNTASEVIKELNEAAIVGEILNNIQLESPPVEELTNQNTPNFVTVVKGDTMLGIAEKYAIDIQKILDLNPQFDRSLLPRWTRGDNPGPNDKVSNTSGRNPNWIFPGEKIVLREEQEVVQIEQQEQEQPNESVQPALNTDAVGIEVNIDNVFQLMLQYGIQYINITYKETDYSISNMEDIEKIVNSFGPTQTNNPVQKKKKDSLIKKAWNEGIEDSNSIIGLLKGGKTGTNFENSNFWLSTINIIGLCGISKLGSHALKCLLGGTSINQFYDAMLDKFFEFIELNTLDLFLNNLPFNFRSELNEAIQNEFGSSFTDLLNIKRQDNNKVRDVVNYKVKNQIFKIFEKAPDPLNSNKVTPFEKELLLNNVGKNYFYGEIKGNFDYYHNNKTWLNNKQKKKAKKTIGKSRRNFLKGKDEFTTATNKLRNTVDLFGKRQVGDSQALYERKLNAYERTSNAIKETNLGTSTDTVFDVVFDFTIDYIIDNLTVDLLVEEVSKYPAGEWLVSFATDFFKSCPHPSLFDPPVKDFMKSFSLDVCDPLISFSIPKLQIPNISLRYNIDKKFGEIFSQSITDLWTITIVGLIKRTLKLIEDALCKFGEVVGRFIEEGVKNKDLLKGVEDNFISALDKAFCGGSRNPETGKKRAEELANNLLSPFINSSNNSLQGMSERLSNIISGVSSQNELLDLMANGNEQTAEDIANAITFLEPDLADTLGSATQVSYFFENLGSYLSEDDKQRIRDLLDDGLGNVPTSASICLTNDQLIEWENVRRALFQNQGLTPEEIEEAINRYNEETEEALESVLDDVGEINSEGPFVGALSNQALSDLCNPNNIFNTNSQSSLDKQESDEMTEDYYNNILRMLMLGFFNPMSGVLANALRDKNNATQLKRTFSMYFNPNYMNSVEEQIKDYDDAGFVKTFLKDTLGQDSDGDGQSNVEGEFPDTVGGYLRESLLTNIKGASPEGIVISYVESDPNKTDYYLSRLSMVSMGSKSDFHYSISVRDFFGKDAKYEYLNLRYEVPNPLTIDQRKFLQNLNIFPEKEEKNLRLLTFESYLNNSLSLDNKDHTNLFNDMSNDLSKNVIESLVTNSELADEIPLGFKFGYVSDDLNFDELIYYNQSGQEYTSEDAENKVIGTYRNDRVKVLNPDIYGGSYESPMVSIEPRKFFGWLEFAMKAFESREGCDPKRPPILGMQDIKDRVKYLNTSLRDYPELTSDPDCVSEKPFKLLVDSAVRANLDGVVRTTIRTYLAEAFFKAAGIFSNLQLRKENYDASFMMYVVEDMKSEMLELGTSFVNSSITIKKEKYWYTFMEQVVQVYATMVELGEVSPPPAVSEALEQISSGQMVYQKITKETRKSMSNKNPWAGEYDLPANNYLVLPKENDLLNTISSPQKMGLLAILFKTADQEFRDNFVASKEEPGFRTAALNQFKSVKVNNVSIKKLNFFSKILFVRMYEKQCKIIMAELLSLETSRISESAFEGLNDKPFIYDLHKSFFGFKNIFKDSSSQVGLNSYYLKKQFGTASEGLIAQSLPNNTVFSKNINQNSEEEEIPTLILEGYARLEERKDTEVPLFISERPQSTRGVSTLTDMLNYISSNLPQIGENMISDFFGDLKFLYSSSFKKLFDRGMGQSSIEKLIKLNSDKPPLVINRAYTQLVTGASDYQDFDVLHDESFLEDGENRTPYGVYGNSGIFYGIRISLVIPERYFSSTELQTLRSNQNLRNKSLNEKAYLFDDGKIVVPIVVAEVPVVDCKFNELDPFSGKNRFDLECLINKAVQTVEFQMFFDKVFPLKSYSSTAAIYCCKNFMQSLGRGEEERANDIELSPFDDSWDGTSNTFVKNFMRREFQSLYLANSVDGFAEEPLDERERSRILSSFNPFGQFALPSIKIPWFKKRRIKTKVYDKDGNECADPLRDLY
jgi:LysM repeat protein